MSKADMFSKSRSTSSRRRKAEKTYKCLKVQGDKYRYRITDNRNTPENQSENQSSVPHTDHIEEDGVLNLCVRKDRNSR